MPKRMEVEMLQMRQFRPDNLVAPLERLCRQQLSKGLSTDKLQRCQFQTWTVLSDELSLCTPARVG